MYMQTQDFPVWECLLGEEISAILIAVVLQCITIIVAEKILARHGKGQCLILMYFIYTFLGHLFQSGSIIRT